MNDIKNLWLALAALVIGLGIGLFAGYQMGNPGYPTIAEDRERLGMTKELLGTLDQSLIPDLEKAKENARQLVDTIAGLRAENEELKTDLALLRLKHGISSSEPPSAPPAQ